MKRDIAEVLAELGPDVAFNALHGKWGEDGCMSAILETMQIPYTHSGVLRLGARHGQGEVEDDLSPRPASRSPTAASCRSRACRHAASAASALCAEAACAEGSSVGVHIVDRSSNGPAAMILEQRELYGDQVMAERFVPGRELTCAVMGDVALGVIEIRPGRRLL